MLLRQLVLCFIFLSVSYAVDELLLLPLHHSDVDSLTLIENNELLRKNLNKAYFQLGTVILLNKPKFNCEDIECAKKWGSIFDVNWVFFPKILRIYREWVIQVFLIDIKADTVYTRTVPIPYGIYKLEDIVFPLTRHFVYRTIHKEDWKNDAWIDSVEVILTDSLLNLPRVKKRLEK